MMNECDLFDGDGVLYQARAASSSYQRLSVYAHDHQRNVAPNQLEARVAQRTHELMAAFEVSQQIVAQLDLNHLLRSVTEQAQSLFHARVALLCLLTPNGKTLELVAGSGWSGVAPGLCQPACHGLARQVVGANQTVMTETACTACAVLHRYGSGCCAVAPLKAGTTTLGALCVVREQNAPFDPDQTRSLTLLANAAAIAITNARLTAEARQEAARAASCAEREQLAAELHDHLAQTLGFLNLKADRLQELLTTGDSTGAAGELAQMQAAITVAYAQVRAALTGLRQPPSSATDLAEKLAACVAEFRADSGPAIELRIADSAALALSPGIQTQVLHIVREALTNVRRHAQAQFIQVRVEHSGAMACFTVEDDGCGFDPHAPIGDHHLGLTIMRTRAERSGGQLLIDSAPGAGTKLLVRLPLPETTS